MRSIIGVSDLDCRTIFMYIVVALTIFSTPNVVLGQNLNLSGNLNINDTQVTHVSDQLLSMLISLAESIIPIVVGAAVGHKSIAYWQEKKDKMLTKNNILAGYAQSFKIHGPLLDNFAHRVFKSYVIFKENNDGKSIPLNDYSNAEDKVGGFLKFPSDPNELPSKRFYEEYRELYDKIDDISQARERLYLDLKYFRGDSNKIIEKLQGVKSLLKRSELLLDKFMKSTDSEDFINCYNCYRSLSEKIKDEMDKSESDLVRFSSGKRVCVRT